MYKINAAVRGVAPILQHRFADATLDGLMKNAQRRTAKQDYSLEWMQTMYVTTDGYLYQPANHFESAMIKASANFKMSGRKTFKDAFKGYVYVMPDQIIHLWNGQPVLAPDENLLLESTEHLSINVMRVVVQRAAVARSRLQIEAGWELQFTIEVHDENIVPETVQTVLEEAGHAFGIGDYRPRFGRFDVIGFAVQ